MKTFVFITVLFSLFASMLISCNLPSTKYRGKFLFYENDKLINGPVSIKKFIMMKAVLKDSLMDFGIIEEVLPDDAREWELDHRVNHFIGDTKQPPIEKYLDWGGSNADISVAMCNDKNYFRIIVTDWSNQYETRFVSELKQAIVSSFKNKMGFGDIVFSEIGEFILNN
jgi:hypothetical protein